MLFLDHNGSELFRKYMDYCIMANAFYRDGSDYLSCPQ